MLGRKNWKTLATFLGIEMGVACTQANSQSLDNKGPMERNKKTRKASNKLDGRHEETCFKIMNQSSMEQGGLEEIY